MFIGTPLHPELNSIDRSQQVPLLHHAQRNALPPYVASLGSGGYNNDPHQIHPQNYITSELRKPKILKFLVLGAAGAGKTSILRRYFYDKFDWDRMPTLGSDFYSTKLWVETGNSHCSNVVDANVMQLNIQMWDTPGKERYVTNSKRKHSYAASSISESFFTNADVIMLVYDMTSSTSFKQLLKWYADLMEMYQRDNQEKLTRIPPVLVCANKLDLFNARNSTPNDASERNRVQLRDVFGFKRNFRGHDFRYEYQICPLISNRSDLSAKSNTIGGSGFTTKGTNDNKRRMEISSYLANRENWTSDGSYLESLLDSEDVSHPDREMVLLWCLRNGLSHCEVSAATGEGVNNAIDKLIDLALQQLEILMQDNEATNPMLSPKIDRNDSLDFHQRYSPQAEKCCLCNPRSIMIRTIDCCRKLLRRKT